MEAEEEMGSGEAGEATGNNDESEASRSAAECVPLFSLVESESSFTSSFDTASRQESYATPAKPLLLLSARMFSRPDAVSTKNSIFS